MCMGLTEVMDPELQEGKDGANKHTYWVARHGTTMHSHTTATHLPRLFPPHA